MEGLIRSFVHACMLRLYHSDVMPVPMWLNPTFNNNEIIISSPSKFGDGLMMLAQQLVVTTSSLNSQPYCSPIGLYHSQCWVSTIKVNYTAYMKLLPLRQTTFWVEATPGCYHRNTCLQCLVVLLNNSLDQSHDQLTVTWRWWVLSWKTTPITYVWPTLIEPPATEDTRNNVWWGKG